MTEVPIKVCDLRKHDRMVCEDDTHAEVTRVEITGARYTVYMSRTVRKPGVALAWYWVLAADETIDIVPRKTP